MALEANELDSDRGMIVTYFLIEYCYAYSCFSEERFDIQHAGYEGSQIQQGMGGSRCTHRGVTDW